MDTGEVWTPMPVRKACEERGWSVVDLAVATGIDLWALYKYLALRKQSRRRPPRSAATAMADALGLDPAVLWVEQVAA